MLGNDVIIYVGGTAFAAAKSCDIDVKADMIEVSSSDTGVYRKYIAGRKTWEVTVNCLVTETLTENVLTVGTTVTLTMGVRVRNHPTADRLTGTAIVRECRVSGTRGNMATGSFKFQGISELGQLSGQLQSNDPYDLQETNLLNLESIIL